MKAFMLIVYVFLLYMQLYYYQQEKNGKRRPWLTALYATSAVLFAILLVYTNAPWIGVK